MELKHLQERKYNVLYNANAEFERVRLFIKHLSFINERSNNDYNITKSVIKEIDSFKMDTTNYIDQLLPYYDKLRDTKDKSTESQEIYECVQQNAKLCKNIEKEMKYLKNIIYYLSDGIMKRYQIQKLNEYRPFRHYWDQKEFEQIFIAAMCMNLPFNINYAISLYAVGKILNCHNPHKVDKELLILHENEHKQWFMCDLPLNAIVCSRCFRKYVKQCSGCKQIVLSNTIDSLTIDGKWYCVQSIQCISGFSNDYIH